jgi:hypothetical protein
MEKRRKEANIEYLDAEYEDIDGDGTLDWHPAVGSYVSSKQVGARHRHLVFKFFCPKI